MKSVTTFLLFVGDQAGNAEEAIGLYTSVFSNSSVVDVERYSAGESEPEGSVKVARFTINATELMAMDSSLDHQFGFSLAVSLHVECDSPHELESAFQLSCGSLGASHSTLPGPLVRRAGGYLVQHVSSLSHDFGA